MPSARLAAVARRAAAQQQLAPRWTALGRRASWTAQQQPAAATAALGRAARRFSADAAAATPPAATAPEAAPARRTVERPNAISITPAAAKRIAGMMASRVERGEGQTLGVRLGVRTRGCNGKSYTMDYQVEPPGKLDEVVEEHGVLVCVEPKAVFQIIGTQMDFVETRLASEFVFHNPNAKGSCGCGESFNT